ncbi:hypothetical protein FOCC_FOCC015981 [Frankliniella occidentalis]|nr:hypothetical protein FOCC_FOCC015981 [Frankliniella occidentalis]
MEDHLTKIIHLRPLKTKTAEEVAGRVLKMFLVFGALSVMQSVNRREYCNKIIGSLRETWPEIKIVHAHGKLRHSQSQGSVERANQDIQGTRQTPAALLPTPVRTRTSPPLARTRQTPA